MFSLEIHKLVQNSQKVIYCMLYVYAFIVFFHLRKHVEGLLMLLLASIPY